MDNDDDLSYTPLPNNFLLSTYKENLPQNETNLKDIGSYKCCSCKKKFPNPVLTCSKCVNTGEFCSSTHDKCTNKRREVLLSMLNKPDDEEFDQYTTDKTIHFKYSDRMSFLKKINSEKNLLQFECQEKIQSSAETRQIFDEIPIRKNRFHLIHQSIKKLQEEIERKKQINIKTQQHITEIRTRIDKLENKIDNVKKLSQSAREKTQIKIHISTNHDEKLDTIRHERFHELHKYLFPIQRLSAMEQAMKARIRDISNAIQATTDEINNDPVDNNEGSSIADRQYQIVDSWLRTNGDYQIDIPPLTPDTDTNTSDPDSPQSSPTREFYETLSGLSHACQLLNVMAFYLHINLPFRLHQLEFNTDILTVDYLRANIGKLNTNIISSCLSQGIPLDFNNVKYTLENLSQLITLSKYRSRPEPVEYSEEYIKILEEDVNEISRTYITDYWFDDEDNNNDRDVADILNDGEWEAIPQVDYIPDDPFLDEHGNLLSSSSSQQTSSIMSNSYDYFKTKGSGLFNSIVRNFKS